MDRIPHTYLKGYPEGPDTRETAADFWAWLEQQPLQAWLFYARGANWDNADGIFEAMVAHPRCDLAVASWLFWHLEPDFWLERGEASPMLRAILNRCDDGGFASGAVHYERAEVAWSAFRVAQVLHKLEGPPVFRIPLQLCRNFEGINPPIGPYSPEVEADLAEIFNGDPGHHSGIWGTLWRSDDEYFDWQRRGGNWWFEPALRLPDNPKLAETMAPVQAIDAMFGEHQSSLKRIEQERLRGRRKSGRSSESLPWVNPDPVARWVGLAFAVACFSLAYFIWQWR